MRKSYNKSKDNSSSNINNNISTSMYQISKLPNSTTNNNNEISKTNINNFHDNYQINNIHPEKNNDISSSFNASHDADSKTITCSIAKKNKYIPINQSKLSDNKPEEVNQTENHLLPHNTSVEPNNNQMQIEDNNTLQDENCTTLVNEISDNDNKADSEKLDQKCAMNNNCNNLNQDEQNIKRSITEYIKIRGAKEHNLKNLNLDIPKNKFIVITGISGSGKSSLAFDTLYAEGQRRYLDNLSSYARHFMNVMQKPDVNSIEGISPAIALEQKTMTRNPRSTVGTMTEIYDYLRLLFSSIGVPISPKTNLPITSQSRNEILQAVLNFSVSDPIYILAPILNGRKGEFKTEFNTLKNEGYEKVFINGTLYKLNNLPLMQRSQKYDVSVLVDTITVEDNNQEYIYNKICQCLDKTSGVLIIKNVKTGQEQLLSEHYYDPATGICVSRLTPRLFSFNNAVGACKICNGLGVKKLLFDLISDEDEYDKINQFLEPEICPKCLGARLSQEALLVKILNKNIAEISNLNIRGLLNWIRNLRLNLSSNEIIIVDKIIHEIETRLLLLIEIGLDYVSISRSANSLSGGETQRIKLVTQIRSGLSGVLYVLDEPSIGLHARDITKLIGTLNKLKDNGNSIIVVEHDETTMRNADLIIDIGPKAGTHGGKICAMGTIKEIENNTDSITGKYLSGRESIKIPIRRKIHSKHYIQVINAHKNNLKNINVKFPLGVFTCVTGVSGSGKSTLVLDTLFTAVDSKIKGGSVSSNNCDCVHGIELIDNIININQLPIGRTPRSNPITYVGCFSEIRKIFANTTGAKELKYSAGDFSFNVKGGRCETCKGDGVIKIEMHFLPDTYVTCEQCGGKRFKSEALNILYKGKNIYDVLEMTIEEASDFFKDNINIFNKLNYLKRVGLGYLTLGCKATILSGGEAQRIKLAKELTKQSTGNTIYILDEPTTGLHLDDINKLLEILQLLVEAGNTVIVIEHNLEVIKTADWIIDIGPEGGDNGGYVIAEGTPEEVAKNKNSHTGICLKDILNI